MKTAKEMYDYTSDVKQVSLEEELSSIEDYIYDNADNGEFTASVPWAVSDDATRKLQSMGYIVKDGVDDPRDIHKTTIISWKLD
jgi:hypothetical protein